MKARILIAVSCCALALAGCDPVSYLNGSPPDSPKKPKLFDQKQDESEQPKVAAEAPKIESPKAESPKDELPKVESPAPLVAIPQAKTSEASPSLVQIDEPKEDPSADRPYGHYTGLISWGDPKTCEGCWLLKHDGKTKGKPLGLTTGETSDFDIWCRTPDRPLEKGEPFLQIVVNGKVTLEKRGYVAKDWSRILKNHPKLQARKVNHVFPAVNHPFRVEPAPPVELEEVQLAENQHEPAPAPKVQIGGKKKNFDEEEPEPAPPKWAPPSGRSSEDRERWVNDLDRWERGFSAYQSAVGGSFSGSNCGGVYSSTGSNCSGRQYSATTSGSNCSGGYSYAPQTSPYSYCAPGYSAPPVYSAPNCSGGGASYGMLTMPWHYNPSQMTSSGPSDPSWSQTWSQQGGGHYCDPRTGICYSY